jgi:hypothetical protein
MLHILIVWIQHQAFDFYGVLGALSAFCQTAGILLFTTLDTNVNIFVNRNQNVLKWLVRFIAVVIFVFAFMPSTVKMKQEAAPWIMKHKGSRILSTVVVLAMEVIPAYILWRYKEIVEMHAGFLKATDIVLIVVLVILVMESTIPLVSPIPNKINGQQSSWPTSLSVAIVLIGTMLGILQLWFSWYLRSRYSWSPSVHLVMGEDAISAYCNCSVLQLQLIVYQTLPHIVSNLVWLTL